jgi:hypothetical protein
MWAGGSGHEVLKQMDEDVVAPGITQGGSRTMDHRDGGQAKRSLLGGLGGPWTAPLVGGFVVLMVVVAFLAGRSTASAGPAVHDHDHVLEEQLADAESGDRWFTCSMHPQVRTTDPNERCPICGMELIPVAADAEDEGDPSLPVLR